LMKHRTITSTGVCGDRNFTFNISDREFKVKLNSISRSRFKACSSDSLNRNSSIVALSLRMLQAMTMIMWLTIRRHRDSSASTVTAPPYLWWLSSRNSSCCLIIASFSSRYFLFSFISSNKTCQCTGVSDIPIVKLVWSWFVKIRIYPSPPPHIHRTWFWFFSVSISSSKSFVRFNLAYTTGNQEGRIIEHISV
jgi:hypothetical protein